MTTATGTKETQELIAGVTAVVARLHKAKKEGGLTFRKKLGFAADIGEILDALIGLDKIPAEIKDLDAAEWEEVRARLCDVLVAAGFTHRTRDLADRILKAGAVCLVEISDAIDDVRQFPPSAIPA